MARKTRRTDRAAAEEQQAARATAGRQRFGIYARTSHDYRDGGSSLANQASIVRAHLDALGGIEVAEVYEDNGRTGTNQDRPAFQRMLADAAAGRIDGIAAKDASRLGRDWVECQTLITKTLPATGTRVVLVSEGFDSDEADGTTLLLDMKSILDDLYSKDASRKIHASFRAARKRGPLILGQVPYGYKRDEADAHHLVPDPATAPYVARMFEMRAAGASCQEIADWLNEQGAPTAGEVKYARAGMEATSRDSQRWMPHCVNRMLRDSVYVGTLTMCKWTQSLFLGIPHAKNDPDDLIVVENAHEPIADPELFDRLRRRREKRTEARRRSMESTERARSAWPDRLKGKVVCGECGSPMSITRWQQDGVVWGVEYRCKARGHGERCKGRLIPALLVETLAMDAIRAQLKAALDYDEIAGRLADAGEVSRAMDAADAEIASLLEREDYLRETVSALYDERAAGRVSGGDFKRASSKLADAQSSTRRKVEDLAAKRASLERLLRPASKAKELEERLGVLDAFSAELADAAIERIVVADSSHLEIVMRFADVREELRGLEGSMS